MYELPDRSGTQIDRTLMSLAREFAMDLLTRDVILKNHGINPNDAEKYLNHPRFKFYLEEATRQWTSGANLEERVKANYAQMIEMAAPEIYHMIHDRNLGTAARIEAFKSAAKIAGMGERAAGGGISGPGITIKIDMGADAKLVKEVTPQVTIDLPALELDTSDA